VFTCIFLANLIPNLKQHKSSDLTRTHPGMKLTHEISHLVLSIDTEDIYSDNNDTNLAIGMVAEISANGLPYYGTIKWIGEVEIADKLQKIVGLEMVCMCSQLVSLNAARW